MGTPASSALLFLSFVACATAYYNYYGWANENGLNNYPNQWYQSNQWGNAGNRMRRPAGGGFASQRNGYGYPMQSPPAGAAGGGYSGGRSMGLAGQSYYEPEPELLQQDQAYGSPYSGARADRFRTAQAGRRPVRPAAGRAPVQSQQQQQWDMISDGTGEPTGHAAGAPAASGQRPRSKPAGVATGAGTRLNQRPVPAMRPGLRPGQGAGAVAGQGQRARLGTQARQLLVQQSPNAQGAGVNGAPKEAVDPDSMHKICAVADGAGVMTAKWCRPDLEAVALYKSVTASSTCGQNGQQNYCRPPSAPEGGGSAGRVRWPEIVCGKCDSRVPLRSHTTALLTDVHNAFNQTCWLSEPLRRNEENVTLEVAFGKRYEVRCPLLCCALLC